MTLDRKKILKESAIWVLLIIITFIGTSVYTMFKPETILKNKLDQDFNMTYENIMIAHDMTKVKDVEAQGKIDIARKKLLDFKASVEGNEGYISTIGTWSLILDSAQETYITMAKDSLAIAQVAKKDNKADANNKIEDAKILINNLVESKLFRANQAGKILIKEFEKL